MKRKFKVAIFLIVLAGLMLVSRAFAQGTDVAVIVNPNNSVANVTMAELRKIFAGEKRSWTGSVPIKLIVRAPGSRERTVLLKLLNLSSESDYKQYWTAQVIRGEADSEPSIVPSAGMMREAVQAFPGGIGMVDTQSVKPGMKVIKVDGHLPGEPGYPLR
jgi:phosphate transport system substrate-binding protein